MSILHRLANYKTKENKMATNVTYIFKDSIPITELIRIEKEKVAKNILNAVDATVNEDTSARFIRQVVLDQVNGYYRLIMALINKDALHG